MFNGHFSRATQISQYQNVTILDFVGVEENDKVVVTIGTVRRAKLQSNRHHQQTNTQLFLEAGCPSCCPTNSVKALKVKTITFWLNTHLFGFDVEERSVTDPCL